jgi:23S rRNA (cytidine1920-2'-O)/16S rRNA (cytidine1409-2'-O)-methyltransferase
LIVSRTAAQEAIRAGGVLVGGLPVFKPSMLVGLDDELSLASPARHYVSRGGEKLAAALDAFAIVPSGRDCLDAGASTGGFTDCLLQRGAARVVSVDVGYGQLDWRLRNDPRVTVLERKNVKHLDRVDMPFIPDLVVADLSFISLRSVIAALAAVASPLAEFVLLVKPQFEAGRKLVGKGGVVRDAEVWRSAIEGVAGECRRQGLPPSEVIASPLRGPAGNVEFLLHAQAGTEVVDLDPAPALAAGSALKGER